MDSKVDVPTLLVYDGEGSMENSLKELANYQGIDSNKVLYIDWELKEQDFARSEQFVASIYFQIMDIKHTLIEFELL